MVHIHAFMDLKIVLRNTAFKFFWNSVDAESFKLKAKQDYKSTILILYKFSFFLLCSITHLIVIS